MAMLPPEWLLNWLWYVPKPPLEPLATPEPGALQPTCPDCGSPATRTEPGTGPHYARLSCAACKRFLRWLPWSAEVVFDQPEPNTVQASLFDQTPAEKTNTTVPHSRPGPEIRLDFKRLNELLVSRDVIALLGMDSFSVQGGNWRGRCPIHNSTSPTSRSMHVDLSGRRWYCHKCKRGGDLIDLYAQARGITVVRAATELARHFGFSPGRE